MKPAIRAFSAVLLFILASVPAWAQVNITTERYDTSRTGANLNEAVLTTSNVNSTQFGKLYSYVVDGSVQAQPLYISNLTVPGFGSRNVLFVVTMNDVVYAFDADSNAVNGGILWKLDFRNPTAGVNPIPIVDVVSNNSLNIVGNVGIESTPAIDLSTNTMYLVARTKEVSGTTTNYVARLHALDITTGAEKFGGPVVIQGSLPGNGQGSSGGILTFDPLIQNQRSSLALANGMVVFSWASHEDAWAWHGWVFAYNAQTLQQSSIYCVTPNGQNGGLWMAGRAPVVDASGNLYYASGNGDWDGVSSFGDSVLKIGTAGGTLSLLDYFTPDDYAALQTSDQDLGSSGPLLIPGTNLLVHGGKESIFYLMNMSSLGHEQSGNNQIVQHFTTTGSAIHGGPVFWNRATGSGPTLYIWPNDIGLQAYQFSGTSFNIIPISQSTIVAAPGSSGGVLTLSANGSTVGSGIVWSSMPINEDADHGVHQAVLRAFDANDLTTELWDSQLNAARDAVGLWPKYSPPTVANGRVYVAAFPSDGVSAGAISVYGLLGDFSISGSPSSNSVAAGGTVTYTVNTNAISGFLGSIALSASGLPAGATASYSPATVTGAGSSTLTVTTTGSTPVGTSTLTLTGVSGTLTHTTTVSLVVNAQPPPPDFTITGTPSTQTVVVGSAATYTANIGALSGFAGVVTLSASGLPAGATASYSPATVTGAGSSTLTVTTAGSTPVGTSTLTLTGVSGSVTHTATVTLTVTVTGVISIDFVGQGTAMGSTEVAGVVAKSNWNNANGLTNTTAQALVNESGTGTGATVIWNTNGIWNLPITDAPGNVRMLGGYLDPVGGTTTVTVAGLVTNAGGYDVYVYADGDNGAATRTGAYQISGTGITTTSVNLTDAANTNFSGTYTQANNSNGNYVKFTITATGFTITATPGAATDGFPRAPVNGIQIVPYVATTPDFTFSASPSTQPVIVGNSTTYTVNVGAVAGFTGVVTLSASGLPAGATASYSPATVTGAGSSTLTVTTAGSTPVGTSTLTLTGVSGSVTHTATVTLTVTVTGVISIDFVGQGTAMGSTEVAGVVAKSNWNNANGLTNTTAQALVNESGTGTGATVIWNTNGIWNLPITDAPGNVRMLGGYLDPVGGTTTVTVAGLVTNAGGYDVYVYADGDNGAATRTGAYQISGTGITTTSVNLTDAANTNFSGTYTQANNSNGNHVQFTITATGFTITATPGAATDGYPRAPVNGIQIVPH